MNDNLDSDNVLEPLRSEADRLMAQGLMKPLGRLWELFDFLLNNAAQDTAPTEATIALEVFGKSASDIGTDDASVRVYIHRLRKRLSDHYAKHPPTSGVRLSIPKGSYRLCLNDIEPLPLEPKPKPRFPMIAVAIGGLAILNLLAWGLWSSSNSETSVASSAMWEPFQTSDMPTMLVVGDYFIFQPEVGSNQLVRDFSINSSSELAQARRRSPERYGTAVDLDLHYLPVSTAYALAKIGPHIQPKNGRLNIITASEVSVSTLKNYNVIYIGLLSGMDYLLSPVFENSSVSIGDNFDQIIDLDSQTTYVSSEIKNIANQDSYIDYGYWSVIEGPSGNLIATLAATRDTGLRGLADFIENSEEPPFSDETRTYEILLEVKGEDKENLTETVLLSRY